MAESDLIILNEQLEQLQAELDRLYQERQLVLSRCAEIDARLRELHGEWGHGGLIKQTRARIRQAELLAADDKAVAVVWDVPPAQWRQGPRRYIIDKVTPKRIFVREAGKNGPVFQFRRDGTPISSESWRINVSATLGPEHDPQCLKTDSPKLFDNSVVSMSGL